MAAELRWILLALSLLLLAGIWWWGARGSRQAPGNSELRESKGALGAAPAPAPASTESRAMHAEPREPRAASGAAPVPAEGRAMHAEPRDWGVPPLEPLSIRTAEFDDIPTMDMPMRADPDAREPIPAAHAIDAAAVAGIDAPSHADPQTPDLFADTRREPPPDAPSAAAAPHTAESAAVRAPADGSGTQRIVSVRVCAQGETRWAGSELKEALETHGLDYGRYKVFHRKHSDGRTLFCAASLVEPGTFDIARMPGEEFRGVTLFAVLPGPAAPLATVDALIGTAADLAETLRGAVRDAQGLLLSAQRAEAMREDVARFQALLAVD